MNWAQATSLRQRGVANRLETAEKKGGDNEFLREVYVRAELENIRNDLLFNNIIW
ncbi:hypothetical protein [Capnocytophaga bilenii]